MELKEYELAGIETIARGVAVVDGRVLLCRAKGAKTSYLPGGHIEFGETGREALKREMMEELGVEVETGKFLGVVENKFLQHGKPHAEINLVYEMKMLGPQRGPAQDGEGEGVGVGVGVGGGGVEKVAAKESWIEFEWRDLGSLDDAGLLPEEFRKIGKGGETRFEV